MYWRYLLSIFFSSLLVAFISEQLNLLNLINNFSLMPTVFWCILAVFFILITLFQNKGLPYVFLGSRLHLSNKVWCRFNLMNISLFFALAIIAYIVNQVVNEEVWALYKLFGQPIFLVLIPLLSLWLITRRITI
ncbi:septation protein IspZ [Thalassomonas sp. M1454]|uniref:septation protein IspZ n=1 Tax=Thalassomonas sp. M1454 TaxID=2594477 RepID=UPI00391C6E06